MTMLRPGTTNPLLLYQVCILSHKAVSTPVPRPLTSELELEGSKVTETQRKPKKEQQEFGQPAALTRQPHG